MIWVSCWISWTSLQLPCQEPSLPVAKSPETRSTMFLLGAAKGTVTRGRGRWKNVLCGWVAHRIAHPLWFQLWSCWGSLWKWSSWITACVHLSGRVLHLCIQPFVFWDSARYSIKPIVSQQPSITQNSRTPRICQEIKRLLGLLWLPIHEPFWLGLSQTFPLATKKGGV